MFLKLLRGYIEDLDFGLCASHDFYECYGQNENKCFLYLSLTEFMLHFMIINY